jgi:phospholipase/carboxylesterase
MDAMTINNDPLPYVLVQPDGFTPQAGYPLVVLMHGFGANMYDLTSLAPAIDAEGYVYAFPNAPYSLQIQPGMMGYSWAANRPGITPPPEGAPDIETMLDAFMADVTQQTGAQPGRVVLGGFSQGGGLTLRYGLPRPESFTGLAVLSGFFRDEETVRPRIPAQKTQSIFVAHGTVDPVVPIDGGRATRTFLQSMGYAFEYHEYEMQHAIAPEEVRDLTAWLHATLPPLGA